VGSPACNPHPFQSTPPSQEATRGSFGIVGDEVVSIHAPLTGGDCIHSAPVSRQNEFQSTPPSREATRLYTAVSARIGFQSTPPSREATRLYTAASARIGFQSTPPSREATRDADRDAADDLVSIHAPLTGGDTRAGCTDDARLGFNPRPPHGRRLANKLIRVSIGKFQSTPPSREATRGRAIVQVGRLFQSTPPSREATPLAHPMTRPHDVSIHAPLTGGDRLDPSAHPADHRFNPRPSHGR